MGFVFDTAIFILSFLTILGFLVFFHELGHYSVARAFNTSVERFSIGFGKPIKQWRRKNGELWSIGRIPLGGYVKFLGDSGAASNPDRAQLEEIEAELEQSGTQISKCFHFKPLYQRVLIVLAGPMANFLLAILITAALAMKFGTLSFKSVISEVVPQSAAYTAGLQAGDHLLTLDGRDVSSFQKLAPIVAVRSGVTMQLVYDRAGEQIVTDITPQRRERRDFIGGKNQVGTIGIQIGRDAANVERISYGPVSALNYGVSDLFTTVKTTGTYIGRIFTGQEDGKALGGVARIATMTGKTAVDISNAEISHSEKLRNMIYTLLSLTAALSIGLGVANLMPIPALDGGHLVYYGYEALAGRPLSEQKQEFGFRIGFAILLTLMVVLTINDIGYIRSLFS